MGSPFDMKYLIDNRLLMVCPLLPAKRFVKYCKERGIRTSEKQLERFEELGIFRPVARRCPPHSRGPVNRTLLKTGAFAP